MERRAGEFNVAEDLPVQPVFPSSFQIDLDAPPPESAMIDGSDFYGSPEPTSPTGPNGAVPSTGWVSLENASTSDLQVAVGTVVAYVDQNGNGKLDLVPDGASGYVDKILATNEDELVIYLQGSIPSAAADPSGRMPTEGYNLYQRCDVMLPSSPAPGSICAEDAGAPQGSCPATQWQAPSTKITLSVSTDPQVSSIMCLSNASSGSSSQGASPGVPMTGQPAQYPLPCDPALQCTAPDGSSYTYTSCQTISQGLCEGTSTSCTSVAYARPDPVPSAWPCKP